MSQIIENTHEDWERIDVDERVKHWNPPDKPMLYLVAKVRGLE